MVQFKLDQFSWLLSKWWLNIAAFSDCTSFAISNFTAVEAYSELLKRPWTTITVSPPPKYIYYICNKKNQHFLSSFLNNWKILLQ